MGQRIKSGDAALAQLSAAQKREFEQHRHLVVELLSGRQLVGELPMEGRIRAHNALEAIAAMVKQKSEDDQVVCRRERPVGTRMAHIVCRSVRGRNLEREAAQGSFRLLQVTPLPGGEAGD
ncbi:hypothetical protein [Luteimonas sp. e5]